MYGPIWAKLYMSNKIYVRYCRLNIWRKNFRDNLKNDIHVRKYLVHNLLLTFCVFISINLLIRNNKKNMPALYTKSYLDYAKLQ